MSAKSRSSRGRQATLGGAVVAVLIAVVLQMMGVPISELPTSITATPPSQSAPGSSVASDANARIEAAVRDKRSGFMITVDGEVLKLLPDDNKGSRHQRLLIELATGRTLLVAHNIDLARRVPASRGDSIRIHGQYEWNDRGGVMHWTHHDPDGSHEGGWIEHQRKRYD